MIAPYLTFFILGMIVGGLASAFVVLLFQAHIEMVDETGPFPFRVDETSNITGYVNAHEPIGNNTGFNERMVKVDDV